MLAIVIPYFKITFFEETLKSLAKQTDKRFKVYIGNDASPENPSHIIKSYAHHLDIVYYEFKTNLGYISLTKQWERCIDMLNNEEWLMILCDDDLLSPNTVEEFYSHREEIKSRKIKVVKFASQKINELGQNISAIYFHPKVQDYSDVFYNRFIKGDRSSLSEHIFSRQQYNKYGFEDFSFGWHADDLAWLKFSEFGQIYTINTAVVFFRLSALNISRPNYAPLEKELIKYDFLNLIIKCYLKKFKKQHIPAILNNYELYNYSLNKNNLSFWLNFFPKVVLRQGLFEGLKFTRRFLLNYKSH